jgi:hypothetical protein
MLFLTRWWTSSQQGLFFADRPPHFLLGQLAIGDSFSRLIIFALKLWIRRSCKESGSPSRPRRRRRPDSLVLPDLRRQSVDFVQEYPGIEGFPEKTIGPELESEDFVFFVTYVAVRKTKAGSSAAPGTGFSRQSW